MLLVVMLVPSAPVPPGCGLTAHEGAEVSSQAGHHVLL